MKFLQPHVKPHCWSIGKSGYARSFHQINPGRQYMHVLEPGGQNESKYHARASRWLSNQIKLPMSQPESHNDRKSQWSSFVIPHGKLRMPASCVWSLHPQKLWTSGPHIIRTLADKSARKCWRQLHWSQILYTRNLVGAVFKTATPS